MDIRKIDVHRLLAKVAENWVIKVLSIAVAIILFVFHQMSTLDQRFFSVPLDIESHGNMIPASSYPRTVRVSIRGEASKLGPILEEDIEAYLDLDRYSSRSTQKIPVQIRKKGTTLGIEPLEINVNPAIISMEVDHKLGKMVPVSLVLQGTPQQGYELVSYSLNPSQVQVYGPSTLLGNLNDLSTQPVDLEGRSEDFSATLSLLNQNPLLTVQRESVIEFHCSIRETFDVKDFEVPITLTGLNPQFSATMSTIFALVQFDGNRQTIAHWVPPADFLVADCQNISRPGTYTLRIAIPHPPAELKLVQIQPATVTISVNRLEPEPVPDPQAE
jgi:YbbR domain-containing protein